MTINTFNDIHGISAQLIAGQSRFGYGFTDYPDFYGIKHQMQEEDYQGAQILFFDFENRQVIVPFEKQKNVMYGEPIYSEGFFYFLQGNYDLHAILLYQYCPNKRCDVLVQLPIEEVNLYNLRLVGEPVHVISSAERLKCYYPERFSLQLDSHETIVCIQDRKLYLSEWVEEGLEEGIMTRKYKYYEKMIIKDFKGDILSNEIGSLYQLPDGSWWLS